MVPGLEDCLMNDSDKSEIVKIAELVSCKYPFIIAYILFMAFQLQKGISSARSDDTKGLKGPILDWIVPLGQTLNPPLARNVKTDRGFNHECTGALLCPTGMHWSDPEYIYRLLVPGYYSYTNPTFSTKEKLRSGEMEVPGDQWPVFLYADCQYDAEDAWKGLFRSTLLVSVSYFLLLDTIY